MRFWEGISEGDLNMEFLPLKTFVVPKMTSIMRHIATGVLGVTWHHQLALQPSLHQQVLVRGFQPLLGRCVGHEGCVDQGCVLLLLDIHIRLSGKQSLCVRKDMCTLATTQNIASIMSPTNGTRSRTWTRWVLGKSTPAWGAGHAGLVLFNTGQNQFQLGTIAEVSK